MCAERGSEINCVYGEGEPRNEASNVSNTSGFIFLAIEQKVGG